MTATNRNPWPADVWTQVLTRAAPTGQLHLETAPGRLTLAHRLEEAAAAVHPVTAIKIVFSLLSGLAASTILPAAACAAWAAVGVALEAWGWFATRAASAGKPVGRRGHINFTAFLSLATVWWLVLGAMIWGSGAPMGHATALILAASISAVTLLLFHCTPWVYLAAGAAPAAAALVEIARADGHDWRQMAPIWVMLALSGLFCVSRALKTPSVQESERRINASLRNFEILAENVTDLIARTDMKGVYQYVSPASLELLGYRPDELVGTSLAPLIHAESLATMQAAFSRIIADPDRPEVLTARVRHKDGRLRWLQTSAKAVRQDGVAVGVIGVSRDVTERVAADLALNEAKLEAECANRAKAEFLANVSHEIRTPMNGILGALHLMDREPISPEGRELIRQANDAGRMLSQLLNDVLDFSKIEAGKLEVTPEPMRADEALAAVVALLAGQARAKGVDLRCEITGEGQWIEADPVRVRQVMFNLLGNAVKFTARGHVIARLAVTDAGAERRHVSLEIEDTGIGMSAEAQRHLFERFRQGEGDASRRFGGAGLGLSITQALLRLMGGEINVSSVEGEGSTFRLAFDAPAAEAVNLAPVEVGLLEGVNILLVEDNPTNRLVARTMLTRLGANVEEAEDGVAGLHAARGGGHDLILMDIQMPNMDGVEATRAIRGLAGAVGGVPIIGLTANVMTHQRVQYLAAGMNGVVAKPISPGALLAEIVRVITAAGEASPVVAADAA